MSTLVVCLCRYWWQSMCMYYIFSAGTKYIREWGLRSSYACIRDNSCIIYFQLVLSTLEEEAHAGRMPVLTVELAWIAASKACDLCFNNHNSEYALTVDFVGADYKEPVYSEFIEKVTIKYKVYTTFLLFMTVLWNSIWPFFETPSHSDLINVIFQLKWAFLKHTPSVLAIEW